MLLKLQKATELVLFVRGCWITGVYIFYHFEIMKRLATELHEKKIHQKKISRQMKLLREQVKCF